jgi:hypothetical protein
MEENARITPPISQPLLISLQQSADSTLVESEAEGIINKPSHAEKKQKWEPLTMHDEGSQNAGDKDNENTGMDLKRCFRCHRRRILHNQGVRISRSSCTRRRCMAASAAREAVKALAVEELGLLDRAAARLTEWMQVVVAHPSNNMF